MKAWMIGINSTDKTAHYHLEEAHWWIFFLNDVNLLVDEIFIRLPGSWWWTHVFDPVFQWCESKKERWFVELDYTTIETKHPKRWQQHLEYLEFVEERD